MRQRADLRAARARLQAGALDIWAIEAEFLPRLAHVATMALAQAHSEQQQRSVFLLKVLGTTPQPVL